MTTQPHDLTPVQLEWCRDNMPSFRTANAAVLRRDADCERNRLQFAKPEPVNIVSMFQKASGP